MLAIPALHVDLDPLPAMALWRWRQEKLAEIEAFTIRPSLVVSSGRGWHLYWLLAEPVRVFHDDERAGVIRWVEGCNRALAARLGGDSAHDVTRLMRLPGGVNPKNGQLCRLLRYQELRYASPTRYSFEELADLLGILEEPTPPASVRGMGSPPSVPQTAEAPSVRRGRGRPRHGVTRRDLRSLKPWARTLVISGAWAAPSRYRKYGGIDRSKADMAAIGAMLHGGWSDTQIVAAFCRPDWLIGDKFREIVRRRGDGDGMRYLARGIANARRSTTK